MSYDSTADTLAHIRRVSQLLNQSAKELIQRANVHDESKLHSPEKEAFDELTPKLKELTYGSPEYKDSLKELGEALRHHYSENSHHPEHYPTGINGMDIFDVIEMLCDWCAAVERTKNGSVYLSLEHNRERFKMSDQLADIFRNTFTRMGYEYTAVKEEPKPPVEVTPSTIKLEGYKGPLGEDIYRSILSTGQVAYHGENGISIHPCSIISPKSSYDCPEGTKLDSVTRICK